MVSKLWSARVTKISSCKWQWQWQWQIKMSAKQIMCEAWPINRMYTFTRSKKVRAIRKTTKTMLTYRIIKKKQRAQSND